MNSSSTVLTEDQLRNLVSDLNSTKSKDACVPGFRNEDLLVTLIETASISEFNTTIIVQALTAWIHHLRSTSRSSFASILYSTGNWYQCLDIILQKSDTTRPKALRKFLDTLISCLVLDGSPSIDDILNKLLQPLWDRESITKVKPVLQTLSILLSKKVTTAVQFADIISSRNSLTNVGQKSSNQQLLYEEIFYWSQYQELGPTSGNIISSISSQLLTTDETTGAIWVNPLLCRLRESPDSLINFKSHVLPPLFSSDSNGYVNFLREIDIGLLDQSLDRVIDRSILYVSLDVGKEIGIVEDTELVTDGIEFGNGKVKINLDILGRLLLDKSSSARIAGYSLIITSRVSTKPFFQTSLSVLQRSIPILFVEEDSGVRYTIMSLLSNMIDRIRCSTFRVAQNISRLSPEETLKQRQSLEAHGSFMQWIISYCIEQLHPEAGYQRHVCALKLLLVISKSIVITSSGIVNRTGSRGVEWPFQLVVFSPLLKRQIEDSVMNPFDDIRGLAATMLQFSLENHPSGSSETTVQLLGLIEIAERKMLQGGRADQADGLSRLYSILFQLAPFGTDSFVESKWWSNQYSIADHLVTQLEQAISQARENIAIAIVQFPMHGILSTLRYMLDFPGLYTALNGSASSRNEWKSLYQRISISLINAWDCVKEVLCNEAPEGHMPEELEDEEHFTTKDVLSYSWRALKEASLLIRVLSSRQIIPENNIEDAIGIPFDNVIQMAYLSFDELLALRHRGAFTAVAQAFSACCSCIYRAKKDDILHELYEKLVLSIHSKSTIITRRSAGLPSLMIGIVSADPSGPLLAVSIGDLSEIAQSPVEGYSHGDALPQVHAMNCLKAIFTTSPLATQSEVHVTKVLGLAGKCLTSTTWAIRNCGLMLFHALIERLLGNNEHFEIDKSSTSASISLSWGDIRGLQDALLPLLDIPASDAYSPAASIESVFPALKITQKVHPPETLIDKTKELILRHCQSSHWLVRDMAARTFISLIPENQLGYIFSEMLQSCINLTQQNYIHGRLLCTKYALSRLSNQECMLSPDDFDIIITSLQLLIDHSASNILCLPNRAAVLDMISSSLECLIRSNHPKSDKIRYFTHQIHMNLSCNRNGTEEKRAPGSEASLMSLIILNRYPRTNQQDTTDHTPSLSLQDEFNHIKSKDTLDFYTTCERLLAISSFLTSQETAEIVPVLWTHVRETIKGADQNMSCVTELITKLLYLHSSASRMIPENKPWQSLEFTLITNSTALSNIDVEGIMRLWAQLISNAIQESSALDVRDESMSRDAFTLLSYIQTFANDHTLESLRICAVECAMKLDGIIDLSIHEEINPIIIRDYLFLLYDFLLDDSEDVREIAADMVCIVHQRRRPEIRRNSAVPLVASTMVISMISEIPEVLKISYCGAIERMTTSRLQQGIMIPSIPKRFEEAMLEDLSLFAVEKQNLFICLGNESNIWGDFLSKQEPSMNFMNSIEKWVLEGLHLLLSTVELRRDGSLGYSSQPDMFILLTQLLNTTNVLLQWLTKMGKTEIKSKIVSLLEKLVSVGQKNELHQAILVRATALLKVEVDMQG